MVDTERLDCARKLASMSRGVLAGSKCELGSPELISTPFVHDTIRHANDS